MKQKHTRGPWELSDCGWHVIGQADQDDILEVANLEGTFNHESNARLISAAPELLDALESIISDFLSGSDVLTVERINQMKNAVNKARLGLKS